jgi:hypothetical protein
MVFQLKALSQFIQNLLLGNPANAESLSGSNIAVFPKNSILYALFSEFRNLNPFATLSDRIYTVEIQYLYPNFRLKQQFINTKWVV